MKYAYRCHLCGKVKDSTTEWRALYKLAFHYDRRHKGWTHEPLADAEDIPTDHEKALYYAEFGILDD